ncbi:MAG: hypothetical protein KC444_05090 [Nitrosopumilus sp.]|nr:hypothetical protein [Nitrosopumilus sp.]
MKTKFLIIIGIVIAIAISIIYVSLAYNQEIKLATGMMINDEKPQPSTISNPMCFEIDTSAQKLPYNNPIEVCFPLSDFKALGCTEPMIEHIYKYTNLFERDFDEAFIQNLAGLSDDVSEEEYETCLDSILEKRRYMVQHMEFESFSLVQGTKVELEGIIVDMRLDSAHQYLLFTNDPRFIFSTGSNGINLTGLHDENNISGKIVKLSGTRMPRDLGIHVDSYETTSSLIPSYGTLNISNAKDILDVSIAEIYENPEQFYNRFIRVVGDLSEYETHIAYAGVGCTTAKYEISDEFSSDFSSSRHLQDGEKIIGVRIGAHDDLGKVNEPLSDELKSNKVTVMGVFVPSVVEKGNCNHTIHKSGYILTEFDRIKILEK